MQKGKNKIKFDKINNLSNISFNPEYAALCGITKEELLRDFTPEVKRLAAKNEWTFDEAIAQLTTYYDGYHFSHENMVDIFNPFSLVNALSDSSLKNYWASSGATSLLPKFVDDMEIRLNDFDHSALLGTTIETSDVTGGGSELFLVHSHSVHISMVVLMRQQSKLRLSNMPNRSKLTSAR